jgi:hypothetical protein
MVRNRIENGCATDEFAPIGFFKDNQFSEADKLALLNFLMREFCLKQPLVLRRADCTVAAQFLVEHYVRQHAKIDLLYLCADALRDRPPSQISQLWDLVSRKGIICIESSDADEAIEASALPAGAFEAILVSPGFSIFARVDGERPLRSMRYQVDLFRRKLYIERKRRSENAPWTEEPEVTVIRLSGPLLRKTATTAYGLISRPTPKTSAWLLTLPPPCARPQAATT